MSRLLTRVAAGTVALLAASACSSHTPAPTATTTATTTQSTTATATQTATATKTATATATQTTTPSAPSSSASPATGGDSAAPALTQRYCVPNSKLCFRYPEGYQIVKDPQPANWLTSGDFGHLADAQGTPLLYFQNTGGGALAGAEVPDPPTHQVLRANRTAAVADHFGKPIYADAVAVQVPGKGYFLRQFLTASDRATQPGTFRSSAFASGTDSAEYLDFLPDNLVSLTTRNWDASVPRYYATREDAAQQLNNPTAQIVARVLDSVTTA